MFLCGSILSKVTAYFIVLWPISALGDSKHIACVASVPVRAERNIRPQEAARRSFTFGTRGKWGESKKDEGGGWGRGKKGTLARKPLYSENPVRPRTGLLIGAAWFI